MQIQMASMVPAAFDPVPNSVMARMSAYRAGEISTRALLYVPLFAVFGLVPALFEPLPCCCSFDRVNQHGSDNGSAVDVFPL